MSVFATLVVIGTGFVTATAAVVTAFGTAIAAIGTVVGGAVGLTGLSTLAATAIGSGVISGTITAFQGGSLEDVLKSAVIAGTTAYVGGSVGNYVSQSVTAGLSGSVSSTTAAGLGTTAGNIAAGVTRAAIMGKDLERGAILGLAASTSSLLNMSSDFRELPDVVKNVVSVSASTLIRGGDVKEAAVMAAISSGNIIQKALGQSPELKAFMEDPKNKYATEIALTTMNTALATSLLGGDVSKSTEDALVVASIEQMGNVFKEEFTNKVEETQKKYAKAEETQKKLEPNYAKQREYAANYESLYADLKDKEQVQLDAIAEFNSSKASFEAFRDSGYIQNNQFYINGENFTQAYNDYIQNLNAVATEANKTLTDTTSEINVGIAQLEKIKTDLGDLQQSALPLEQVYAAEVKEVNEYTNKVVSEGQKFVDSTNKAIVSTLYPEFNGAEYAKVNALDEDVDPYTHWVNFGKEENAPINYADAVSKDFADHGLTVPPSIAKEFVGKMSAADNPVDALDDYFAERTLTPEEVMAQATKAGVSLTAEEATELAGFGDKAKLSKNLDNYLNIVTRTPGEYTQYGEQLAGLADTIVDGKHVVDVEAVEAKETDPYLFPENSGATMRVGSGQKASTPYTFTNQLGESFLAANVTYSDGAVDRIMYDPATDTYKKIQLASAGGRDVGEEGTLPGVEVTGTSVGTSLTADEIANLTVTERDELLRSSVISKEERAALIAAQQKEFNSDVGKLTSQEILELAKEKAIKNVSNIQTDAIKTADKNAGGTGTTTPPVDTTTPTTGGTGTNTPTTDTTTPPVDTTTPPVDTTTPTTGGTDTTTPTTGGTDTTTTTGGTSGGTDTTTTTGGTSGGTGTTGGTSGGTTGGTDTTTPPPTDTTTPPTDTTTPPPTDTTTPPTDTTTPPTDTTKPPTDTTTPPTDTTKPPTGGVGDIVKPTADQLRQRQQRTNQLLSLLGAGGGGGGQQQQVNVKAPELAKINYIYDISGPSIFAGPYNTSLDGTETGTVDDLQKIMKR
jgi:hypothetical protein